MQDSNSNFIIDIIIKHKRTVIKNFYRRLILFFPSPPLMLKYPFHTSLFQKVFFIKEYYTTLYKKYIEICNILN